MTEILTGFVRLSLILKSKPCTTIVKTLTTSFFMYFFVLSNYFIFFTNSVFCLKFYSQFSFAFSLIFTVCFLLTLIMSSHPYQIIEYAKNNFQAGQGKILTVNSKWCFIDITLKLDRKQNRENILIYFFNVVLILNSQ